MPQNNEMAASTNKKKKGRAPAHQNTFAFRHNPKSKKTAQILQTPIALCCRRCREKLEWRKKYRKYKPLTQPSICNICSKRNILHAYHTLCASCCQHSDKAIRILEAAATAAAATNENTSAFDCTAPESDLMNISLTHICAVCAKEPALAGTIQHEEQSDTIDNAGTADSKPLSLRQRKALERDHERTIHHKRTSRDDHGDKCPDEELNDELDTSSFEKTSVIMQHSPIPDNLDNDDDNDPFLAAVGGADKLLTGEAYQRHKLMQIEAAKAENLNKYQTTA